MSRLYLIRHAECEFNVRHLVQGWVDSPVTELGIRQSRAAGEYLRDQGTVPTHVYSSTAYRTEVTLREALEVATGGIKVPYDRLDDLREAYFGLLEGVPSDLIRVPAPFGDFLVPFGGESEEHLSERINRVLGTIMEQPDSSRVIAVTSGAAIVAFLNRWAPNSSLWSPAFYGCPGNCSVMTFDYADGAFELVDFFEPHVQ